ncbi:MAG: NUDIX hydrolase [Pseudomonadota bacterium]
MSERWFPHVTVASLVCQNERYLMVEERAAGKLVLNQPAGHLEKGESLTDAVVRETLEETGHRFEPTGLLGVYQFVAGNGETYVRFTFIGEVDLPAEKTELDPAIERTLWMGGDQIRKQIDRHRSTVVMRCIYDFENGRRYPLDQLNFADQTTLL